jgi:hypothetical protein
MGLARMHEDVGKSLNTLLQPKSCKARSENLQGDGKVLLNKKFWEELIAYFP